jgi:hypothetical protein
MRIRQLMVALGVLLLAVPVAAQQYGALYGTVTDENGTALPGATVVMSGIGAEKLAISDERGEFRFLALDPGTYYLKASLDSFSTVEQPNVVIALNRNTTINFELTSSMEDLITVTSESPLLDMRQFSQGTTISSVELETVPTARDPWAILNQTPGVLVGNVNVGGSESGQQVLFLGLGNAAYDNDYLMDGIQVTDMKFGGASTTYYDFEQFESVDISTGGADVTKNSGGVSINMVTRRGTNEFRGSARFLSARADGLGFLGTSSSNLDCGDLHPSQNCDTFTTNSVDQVDEYGFEAGGAAITDRLWFWGSYGVSDVDLIAAGGDSDQTNLENASVKVNGQISPSNSAVASWNNGNKTVVNRGAGPTRSTETLHDQRGPSAFWRFEDTHIFNSNLFLTGSYQKSDLGFQLKAKSGCLDRSCPLGQETLWDSDGVWKQNFYTGHSRTPEEAIKLDGSYFFTTSEVSHELKFGGRIRESTGSSNFAWPGRNIAHIAGENFGESPGNIDFFMLYRGANGSEIEVQYNSLWIQDTISKGNLTLNIGARWDLQTGVNLPGTTGESAVPEFFPEVSFDSPIKPPFDWETITPRIGLTYALGSERDTLLRTSFSQFPTALSGFEVGWVNPVSPAGVGAYGYFLFVDGPEDDNLWAGDEFYLFLGGAGYDANEPTSNLHTMGEGFEPEMTTELIVGAEHSLLPEFVVGVDYTWREIDNVLAIRENVRPPGASGPGRPWVAADFVPDGSISAELPDGSLSEVDTFTLDTSLLETTGFQHYENDARSREYNGLSVTAQKRLANNWALRGYVNFGETEWKVPQEFLDNTDPNANPSATDVDGALYMPGTNPRGRGARFVQAGWQANLNGIYQVALDRPWGFTLAANLYAREGHALPYRQRARQADGRVRTISVMHGATDRFRLPELLTTDLRVEKPFNIGGEVGLTLGIDLFNAFNEATPLSRQTILNGGNADHLLDVVSPRIWKLGVRISWK